MVLNSLDSGLYSRTQLCRYPISFDPHQSSSNFGLARLSNFTFNISQCKNHQRLIPIYLAFGAPSACVPEARLAAPKKNGLCGSGLALIAASIRELNYADIRYLSSLIKVGHTLAWPACRILPLIYRNAQPSTTPSNLSGFEGPPLPASRRADSRRPLLNSLQGSKLTLNPARIREIGYEVLKKCLANNLAACIRSPRIRLEQRLCISAWSGTGVIENSLGIDLN